MKFQCNSISRVLKVVLPGILFLGLFSACNDKIGGSEQYVSSAELNGRNEVEQYRGHAIIAEAIRNVSTEKSRTGQYSVKVDSTHKYGFKTNVVQLKKGTFVQASIWQHKSNQEGAFSCIVKSGDSRHVLKSNDFQFVENDWFKRTHEVYIDTDSTTLEFYVFGGGETIYFDDLTIRKYAAVPVDTLSKGFKKIALSIPEQSQQLLDGYKNQAIKNGVIGKNEKQWVSASIIKGAAELPVELRLKGDWVDHLSSGKDSYRIKLKGEELFMGMRSFSIQHPKTRNYMHAWWLHQLCENENLLATQYDFLPVCINGVNKGVFAVEAHFEKELIVNAMRPKGPILKMDETGLWEHTLRKKEYSKLQEYPAFEASVILPFKKNKTLKKKQSKNNFLKGAQLVSLYRSLHTRPEEIFNIDKIAKYYALLELGNVQHGHQWHNKRFYYNPENQKLECIAFDLNAGFNVNENLYLLKKISSKKGPIQWQLIMPLLSDLDFKMAYLKYLQKFSEERYLKVAFDTLMPSLIEKQRLLGNEIEGYEFDIEYYFARARHIQKNIPLIDSLWTAFLKEGKAVKDLVRDPNYKIESDSILLIDVSVNAYVQKITTNRYRIEIENYHLNTIEVLGFETANGNIVYFDKTINLAPYFLELNKAVTETVLEPHALLFKAKNTGDKVFKKTVNPWPKPQVFK